MFTPRITWPDLPAHVRSEVEATMGATVTAWQGQFGGFSPGVADRLTLSDGRRIFCKAVSEHLNEGSAALCRREIAVNLTLPDGLPVPRMRHGVELDDAWVLLLFDDIEGRHPHTPWRESEFRSALASIARVAEVAPHADSSLPTAIELLGPDMDCLARVVDDAPETLDPWAVERLPELLERAAAARASLVGDALCQLDARADNMVLDKRGTVWLVDWPWACRGPAWLDQALLGLTATQHEVDFDMPGIVEHSVAEFGATPDDVTNLWVGELGYFTWAAEQPAPPNLPTIRSYQASMRDGVLRALKRRL